MKLEEQYDKIYRYCYFKVHHRELAEDLTQETFLRFLESTGYRNTGQSLRYLYTIARNLCIDEYRKKKVEPLNEMLSETLADRYTEDSMAEQLSVRIALTALGEEDRELLLLRYANELPVSVIGKFLKISRFAVYRRLAQAEKELRKNLRKEDFT